MKILVSVNPFDNQVHLSIIDLPGLTTDQIYNIAQIAEKTTKKNLEVYLGITDRGEENE